MLRLASLLFAVLALALAGAAQARKPIVAYIDQTTHKLALYDAETGANLTPPSITITSTPGFQDAMAMSFDGRYVFYAGSDDKLHLFDRSGAGSAVPLPGIDIYAKPTGLSVSNTGLVAFDNNVNGPAVVYDSASGSFVDSGLDSSTNHSRQSHLSGDGHFLATTCNDLAPACPVDSGGHSQLFVQDIPGKADTANPPFDLGNSLDGVDKEHPCINNDGSLVGADVNEGGTVGKQVEIYNRSLGSLVTPPGLNSAANVDDVHCVMSQGAAYIGLISDNEFKVYEMSSASFLMLPADIKAISNPISFVMPFPPPPPPPAAGPPPPSAGAPDTAAPRVLSKRFRKSYGLAGALKHGLLGRITSSEDGRASASATITRGAARHLGLAAAKRRSKRPVKVAAGSVRLHAGHPAKLRLRFTRRARRKLAHTRRVKLIIRLTVKDAAGNATHASVRTTLKR